MNGLKFWKPAAATCLAATLMTTPLASAPVAQAETQQVATTNVSFVATAKSEKSPIYKNAGDKKTLMLAGKDYTDEIFYVRKKAVVAGTTYYQITRSTSDKTPATAWAKEKSLKLSSSSYVKNHATVKKLWVCDIILYPCPPSSCIIIRQL